jgi:hypothetical protein
MSKKKGTGRRVRRECCLEVKLEVWCGGDDVVLVLRGLGEWDFFWVDWIE